MAPRPLPRELLHTIVLRAAAADRDTALALTCVARAVRAWANPFLYHTVVLRTPHALQLFRAAFAAHPPTFFASHVRHLFLNAADPDAVDIVRACAGVHRLAACPPALLSLPDDEKVDVDVAPALPAPYEVTLMGALDDVPWASPLFARTRLLYLGLEPPSPATACDLSLLPALHALAFPYDDGGDDPRALLQAVTTLLESTTLRLLLVLVNGPDGRPDCARKGCVWPQLAALQDARLVVGAEPAFDADDWLAMVQDGEPEGPWDWQLKDWRDGLAVQAE